MEKKVLPLLRRDFRGAGGGGAGGVETEPVMLDEAAVAHFCLRSIAENASFDFEFQLFTRYRKVDKRSDTAGTVHRDSFMRTRSLSQPLYVY
jgi:hypothetical protein